MMSFEEREQWKAHLWQMGRAQPSTMAVEPTVFAQLKAEGLLRMHSYRAMPDGSNRIEIGAPEGGILSLVPADGKQLWGPR